MILRNLAVVCLGIVWFKGVCGASFSQVYVHNGYNGYQVPTLAYGAPGAPYLGRQQIQQNSPPVGSVVPYQQPASFTPCVIPCVPIPSQAYGQPYSPVEKARVVYNTPNPVLVAPNAPSGYEYSYIVYDDQTGSQRIPGQWNNGAVVQGQYTLRQPYTDARPAQYTSDDLKGFNAVVKSYLPSVIPSYLSHGLPGVKPIYLIRAEPCEDPPQPGSGELDTGNGTKNGTEPKSEVKTSKDKAKKNDKVLTRSFAIPELIEDPAEEETTTTTSTTTEEPTFETTTTNTAETTTTEVSKSEDKSSEADVKSKNEEKPKSEEVSDPATSASDTYARIIRLFRNH